MKWILIVFMTILCLSTDNLYSQTKEDINLLMNINKSSGHERYEFVRTWDNEYEMYFSSAFLFYKNFLSSQDGGKCSFTPSCSVYAIEAIKKEGIVVGIINFFDRFSRCNSMSPEDYPKNLLNNTLVDPVMDIWYKDSN